MVEQQKMVLPKVCNYTYNLMLRCGPYTHDGIHTMTPSVRYDYDAENTINVISNLLKRYCDKHFTV